MERALRVVSVERGHDPREFALVAFGGAGPLHAPRLAEELSIPTVLVPRLAGVLSGLGLLTSDIEHTYVQSVVEPLADVTTDDLREWFADLVAEGRETLESEGVEADAMTVERALDLRYRGQSYSLTVPVAEPSEGEPDDPLATAAERFHERHEFQYGHADPDEPVELVTARVRAVGEIAAVDVRADVSGTVDDAVLGERPVGFADGERDVTVYEHASLPPGGAFDGPAVVQADAATTVVHPGQSVTVDQRGTLQISTAQSQP